MPYTCQITARPRQPTLVVRTRVRVEDLPRIMGPAYGAIASYLHSLGVAPTGPPFALYHNTDMQNLEVEIGFPVSRAVPGRDTLTPSSLAAGEYAHCVHTGPYAGVGAAYAALSAWVSAHGLVPGPALEVYLNDPAVTPPEALQTEVMFLLQPMPAPAG